MRSSSRPAVSVVVSTCNRDRHLNIALRSLLDQSLPRAKFEVIVVDGSSTSRTRTICEKYEGITYIYEPRAGLSHARNIGWKAAKGKFVAYLDDDAIASHDWLEMIVQSFSMGGSCIGGKVLPYWEAPRPAWLTDNLLSGLSILDYKLPRHVLSKGEFLFGTNIALKRDILEKIGGFRVDLGRSYSSSPRGLLGGEETDLQNRLGSCGEKCVYDPAIVVTHTIQAQRLCKSWFIRHAFYQGVEKAIQEGRFLLRPGARIAAGLRELATVLKSAEILTGLVSHEAGTRLQAKCSVAVRLGHVYEMCSGKPVIDSVT